MVLPFYALKDFQAPLGEGTQLLRVVLDRTLEMKWFDRMSPLEGALGLAGTAWLLRRRHLAGRVAVVGFLVATLWLSLDLLTALAPQDKKDLVTRVQWARYDFFARNPVMFAAGGDGSGDGRAHGARGRGGGGEGGAAGGGGLGRHALRRAAAVARRARADRRELAERRRGLARSGGGGSGGRAGPGDPRRGTLAMRARIGL